MLCVVVSSTPAQVALLFLCGQTTNDILVITKANILMHANFASRFYRL